MALSAGVSKKFKDGLFWLDVGQPGSERVDQILDGVVRELQELLLKRRLLAAAALPVIIDDPVAQLSLWISEHKLSCLLVLDDVRTPSFELRLGSSSVQHALTYQVWTGTFMELELEQTNLTLLINTGKDDVADKVMAKLGDKGHIIEVDCVNPLLKPEVRRNA